MLGYSGASSDNDKVPMSQLCCWCHSYWLDYLNRRTHTNRQTETHRHRHRQHIDILCMVVLLGDCPVLNPISFELVKCLELLSHWMGPSWMDGYLIRQLLWPVIKEWMSEKQHPHQGKPRHSAAPVATICRFLGEKTHTHTHTHTHTQL